MLAIAAAMLRGTWAHARGTARFVTGAAVPVPADLVFLKQLIEAGTLRNVMRTYSLSEIAEAHRYAQSGHKVGNVAVVVAVRGTDELKPGTQVRVKDVRSLT